MEAEATLARPRRPESEVTWEDLLLRVEVMPRVLRLLLDGEQRMVPPIEDLLHDVVRREERVRDFLELAAAENWPGPRERESGPRGASTPSPSGTVPAQPYLMYSQSVECRTTTFVSSPSASPSLDRFVRLRARNFAMVQRRGIEVWEWEAPLPGGERATIHQVLSQLVAEDVTSVGAMRDALRGGNVNC